MSKERSLAAVLVLSILSAGGLCRAGEQSLVNVTFSDRSVVVADLQRAPGTANYDAGQFAPKLNLLGGGRAVLLLTYFRMNSSQSYDYKEVVSLGFSGCAK